MGNGGPVENIRSFLSSRPPLVVFIFCIGMVAFALISFAYYIKLSNIRSPDSQNDWNNFLGNISRLNFCSHPVNSLDSTTEILPPNYQNVSLRLKMSVLVEKGDKTGPITMFHATVNGSDLGYSGSFANESVKLSIYLDSELEVDCSEETGCVKTFSTCTTFLAPYSIIPFAPRPSTCLVNNKSTMSPHHLNQTMTGHCDKFKARVNRVDEGQLQIMLSLETRQLVYLRMMHSSYFLFVVIVTVLVFGIARGGSPPRYDKLAPGGGRDPR